MEILSSIGPPELRIRVLIRCLSAPRAVAPAQGQHPRQQTRVAQHLRVWVRSSITAVPEAGHIFPGEAAAARQVRAEMGRRAACRQTAWLMVREVVAAAEPTLVLEEAVRRVVPTVQVRLVEMDPAASEVEVEVLHLEAQELQVLQVPVVVAVAAAEIQAAQLALQEQAALAANGIQHMVPAAVAAVAAPPLAQQAAQVLTEACMVPVVVEMGLEQQSVVPGSAPKVSSSSRILCHLRFPQELSS